ncbi:MAG: hypothetical protein KC620_17320, partial [Myxococcales bacterium]|nr:hypothetical protein [Myxococcales bacterium]
RRPMKAPDAGWFVLALGESVTGQLGSELDGIDSHNKIDLGDTVYLSGRAAVWLRGYARGDQILDGLFDRYEGEVHLDTTRRAELEADFRQLIDPETFYPVYGDAADVQHPINTRGPLYVMLRADENTARVGNFKTALQGVELFRYDRSLYGAAAEIDDTTGDFRHQVQAFGADQDLGERHAYVELRGTGGSLYYLPHRELIEGSEQVYIVERDHITGIERARVPLARDADYTVRYSDGRLLLKTPLPSVSMDAFGAALPQPDRGEVLDGHPVYLAIEYDHADPRDPGDTALGVHARETWNDTVSLGGGYVEENRGPGDPAYKLWGADLQLKGGRRTTLQAEFARSQSQNGENLRSEDGGLTFNPFHGRDGTRARGSSYLLRGGIELDDLIGDGTQDHWYTEAYWQSIAPGFYAGGTIQEQGLEKYGALSRWIINDVHTVHLRHDAIIADAPATQGEGLFGAFRRDVTRAGHTLTVGALTLRSELVHTQNDDGPRAPELTTDVLDLALDYRLDAKWTLLLEQETVLVGDSRLHESTADLFTTSFGARYQIAESLQIEGIQSVRWSGDNAAQLGLRTAIDDRHTIYVQERFADRDGRAATTTVLGGEERFGAGRHTGRAYGEYQLDTGIGGERNRAVLGVGHHTQLIEGLTLDAGYERSQVLGGSTGEFSRDAISVGLEYLAAQNLKLSGRYELRYEDNDESFGRHDRAQYLALNNASLALTRDLTLLARFNYGTTLDLELDDTEAELIEGSLGLAWRPRHSDWVNVLFKYTRRYEQRPIDLTLEKPEREENDVISLVPIFELPWHFQLVEKLAWRRSGIEVENVPTVVSHTVLWINRLNYHLTKTWDAGLEYRLLSTQLASSTRQGFLLALDYIVLDQVRLGVGYNFTSFSDDEFAALNEDYGGPFFRVIAQY